MIVSVWLGGGRGRSWKTSDHAACVHQGAACRSSSLNPATDGLWETMNCFVVGFFRFMEDLVISWLDLSLDIRDLELKSGRVSKTSQASACQWAATPDTPRENLGVTTPVVLQRRKRNWRNLLLICFITKSQN